MGHPHDVDNTGRYCIVRHRHRYQMRYRETASYCSNSADVDNVILQNIRIHQECEGRIEKIRPEDHRLASRGLPSDDKRWSRGTDFSIPPHTNNGFFSCSLLNTALYVLKRLPEVPSTLRWHMLLWRNFNITMTSLYDHMHVFQYDQCTAFASAWVR